jgi:hypothetical protein
VIRPLIFALTAALLAGGSSAAEHSALDEAGGVGGSANRVTIYLYAGVGSVVALP